jgi:hypothetical protein
LNTPVIGKSVLANTDAFEVSERASAAASLLASRLVPLLPPLAVLAAIYLFAVNVPYGGEWDLIPLLESLRDGTSSWAHLVSDRTMAVKLVAAPLAWATDFNVIAHMYAGLTFQVTAFIFLWAVLELTLRAWRRRLILPLTVIFALLMFSPEQSQIWLSGWTSLQRGMDSLAVALVVWLLARWQMQKCAFAACLALSCTATLGLPSGVMLWAIVLVAILTRSAMQRRVRWWHLVAWLHGALFLAVCYFAFSTAGPDLSPLWTHPLRSCVFVFVYLGRTLTQSSNLWIDGAAGLAGVILLISAASIAWRNASDASSILPWLWLCSYAVLAAMLTAASPLQESTDVAVGTAYYAGTFFWIGFAVTAAVAAWRRSEQHLLAGVWRRRALIVAVAAWAINCAWLYQRGYLVSAQLYNMRTAGLIEIYEYDAAPDEAFSQLYTKTDRLRQYVHVLEQRRLGPYSPGMNEERRRLEDAIALATKVFAGEGTLDVATCSGISGWAWDAQQPNASVRVDIYDGETLLGQVAADRFRIDLLEAHKGNGRHGFRFEPPMALKDGHTHTVGVRISDTDSDLSDSPKQLVCQ